MKLDFSGLCFTSDRNMFAVSCFDSVHLPQSDRRKGRPKTVREKAGHPQCIATDKLIAVVSILEDSRLTTGTATWRRKPLEKPTAARLRPLTWDHRKGQSKDSRQFEIVNPGDDARSETQAKLADHLT
jgi:hypothetical protein